MLGKLLAAQAILDAQLDELRGRGDGADAALIAECGSQLGALIALQASVSTTKPADLSALKSTIAATVGASTALVQQVKTAVAATSAAESAGLVAVTAATRRALEGTQTDLFGRRIFDEHLRFRDKEDEEAYRRREEETRRYVEQQMAAKTAEGTLNAGGAMMGQMLDAHAHGAGESPDFLLHWKRLVETTRKQREAMVAEGRSTAEFDRNLAAAVRRYLREKGLSEAEIDAKLAVAGDPLEAVKPYLKNDREARELGASVDRSAHFQDPVEDPITTAVAVQPSPAASAATSAAPDVDDVMAAFKAAGVVVTATSEADAPRSGPGAISHSVARQPVDVVRR